MCVGIDDHDLDVGLFVLQVSNGDGDVVEDAVALAVLSEGVVCAAGEADADSFRERCVAGEAGGFDFGGGSGEKIAGGGEAEDELFLAVEGGGLNFLDVRTVVDAQDVVEFGGLYLDDLLWTKDIFRKEHVLGDTEFIHGEGVSFG